jgi:hypothetical protein
MRVHRSILLSDVRLRFSSSWSRNKTKSALCRIRRRFRSEIELVVEAGAKEILKERPWRALSNRRARGRQTAFRAPEVAVLNFDQCDVHPISRNSVGLTRWPRQGASGLLSLPNDA